jgi:hypothetical protein
MMLSFFVLVPKRFETGRADPSARAIIDAQASATKSQESDS